MSFFRSASMAPPSTGGLAGGGSRGAGGGAAEEPGPSTPVRRASIPRSPTSERTQALKDYKLTIEYKHLKQNAPGGVLVVPSFDDLRVSYNPRHLHRPTASLLERWRWLDWRQLNHRQLANHRPPTSNRQVWHGVIFVRKSLYANAIFKFIVTLPPEYNDHNVWPQVRFTSEVYNPYVNFETGELDIRSAIPTWDPNQHFMVTVLTFVKKIFYMKDFTALRRPANREAKMIFDTDKVEFKRRVDHCVIASQETVYDDQNNSPLAFHQPSAAHDALHTAVLNMGSDGSLTVKSKDEVLRACQSARPLVE
mmetsp:Transcript_20193/g.52797  ORF Transcript_20193/g.52797 Transcript_20193/m.52797 type:complete len:308 (-) Transcript_20193:249-1172(-)